MSESIEISIWQRDSQYWLVSHDPRYSSVVLDRDSLSIETAPLPHWFYTRNLAKMNAALCTQHQASQILQSVIALYQPKVRLVLNQE